MKSFFDRIDSAWTSYRHRKKYSKFSVVVGKPQIGKGVWIGPFTLIDGSGGLSIGDGCDLSAGVQIYTHATNRRCVSNRNIQKIDRSPTYIGKNVFIGASSVVLMGVEIGDHAVIGAMALVNSDIPAYAIAVGIPAKIVGYVDIDNNCTHNYKLTNRS